MNTCARQVQACSLRVARLNADGSLDTGADGMYVSDALTSLAVDVQITAGDEFEVKNACGDVCVNVKDCDRLKRLDLTLGLCYPDPELLEMLVGGTVLTSGDAVGYAFPEIGLAGCPNGVSIELWAKRYFASSPDPDFPYEHYVLPRAYFQHGRRTFENGPITIELSGFAIENNNWAGGPGDEFPVASTSVMQSIPTTSLPTPACSYQTLVAS